MNEKTVQEAVARGWCHKKNAEKEMDVDLAEAISQEVIKALTPEKKKWAAVVNGEIITEQIVEAEEWQVARTLLWDFNKYDTFDVIEVDDVIKAAKELEEK